MLLVLPDANDGIAAPERSLTRQAMDDLVASLSMVENVFLPKFVVEETIPLALAPPGDLRQENGRRLSPSPCRPSRPVEPRRSEPCPLTPEPQAGPGGSPARSRCS